MNGIYGTETITLPVGLLTALATSDLRMAVYGLRALYGVVRFLHLIGMAGFIGMVVILDLRGLGLFPAASLDPIRARLALVLRAAFWLTIATGIALFLYDPLGIGLHSMFLPKLLLVVLGYLHARVVQRHPAIRAVAARRRAAAFASLAVWLLVVGASTWNHVERPVKITAALRASTVGKE
ncbi:hypothetical protein [Limobrevibacterium gyesilva]|uniref:Uncharacterized protein n=1 Tax=Limobrevibacterium gyesilva TaxID=2991712 RepID=A0AA42CIJ6_9PROT|nr:hypothetical protein [Limobrevibacterium gyesilva]MCW3475982.1 hypothetical protein [Limobrevibacterium gyesilva]